MVASGTSFGIPLHPLGGFGQLLVDFLLIRGHLGHTVVLMLHIVPPCNHSLMVRIKLSILYHSIHALSIGKNQFLNFSIDILTSALYYDIMLASEVLK